MPALILPPNEPDAAATMRFPANIRRASSIFSKPDHGRVVALPVLGVIRTFGSELSGNEE